MVNYGVLSLSNEARASIGIRCFKNIVKHLQDENVTKVDLGELGEIEGIQREQEFLEFLPERSSCGRKNNSEEKIK